MFNQIMLGQIVAPALQRMADVSAQITQAFTNSTLQRISEIISQINTSPYLDAIARVQENMVSFDFPQLYLQNTEDILTDEETEAGNNDKEVNEE